MSAATSGAVSTSSVPAITTSSARSSASSAAVLEGVVRLGGRSARRSPACARAARRGAAPRGGGLRAVAATASAASRRAQDEVDEQLRIAALGRAGPSRLTSSIARGSVSGRSRLVADQHLVDAAEAPAVGRVDGRPERHRLAVHRSRRPTRRRRRARRGSARRRPVGDDQRRQPEPLQEPPLLLGARQHDRVDGRVAADVVEHLREQPVRLAVVERDVRRRTDGDEDAARVEAELARARRGRARSPRGSSPP